jgi:signal transduction histidine kinase
MIDPHLSGADADQRDLAVEPTRSKSAVRTRFHSRSYRASRRLPAWMGSIRFRLTAVWSILVFGLAALVVGGIYLGLHNSLSNQKISATAFQVGGITFIQPDQAQLVQRSVNERALDALRVYSFWSLLALFFTSLVVGWIVSGRMLRPLGEISNSVREIQASDLKQRIDLGGPNDELRQLADTFDDMLGRLDEAFEGQRQFIHEASHELRNPR